MSRRHKRGGGKQAVTLHEGDALGVDSDQSLVELDDSLNRLASMDPQLAQIVELRFFGGLMEKEIAAALKVSERTVQRGWRMARAWLRRELSAD